MGPKYETRVVLWLVKIFLIWEIREKIQGTNHFQKQSLDLGLIWTRTELQRPTTSGTFDNSAACLCRSPFSSFSVCLAFFSLFLSISHTQTHSHHLALANAREVKGDTISSSTYKSCRRICLGPVFCHYSEHFFDHSRSSTSRRWFNWT